MATIEVRDHADQRYDTCGDWRFDSLGLLRATISDMGNDDYAFLVGIHELIEAWLCRNRGISEQSVTEFDMAFEDNRPEGNTDEPGDDPKAPYHKEHQFAAMIEMMLANALDVDWKEYDKAVNSLSK